ncbi:hypothetical protein PCANC_10918 [Puccinia coronata f. sp. avenae]|uniref:Uncharacterized protein n=1 Tax=Puccinia coronata f. sp. avenae TaxID=200324 RepID=A0A2N5SZV2_9BASI|nr:hypothetical protein PCANC_10918 [Puccinia coronata f. sp. avenae]
MTRSTNPGIYIPITNPEAILRASQVEQRRIARITAHHAAETAAHVADHQKACQQSQSIPNSPPQASPSTPLSTMQDQTSATSRNLGVPPTGSTTPASTSRAPSMDPTGRNNNTTVSLRDNTVAQKASTVPY